MCRYCASLKGPCCEWQRVRPGVSASGCLLSPLQEKSSSYSVSQSMAFKGKVLGSHHIQWTLTQAPSELEDLPLVKYTSRHKVKSKGCLSYREGVSS